VRSTAISESHLFLPFQPHHVPGQPPNEPDQTRLILTLALSFHPSEMRHKYSPHAHSTLQLSNDSSDIRSNGSPLFITRINSASDWHWHWVCFSLMPRYGSHLRFLRDSSNSSRMVYAHGTHSFKWGAELRFIAIARFLINPQRLLPFEGPA